MNPEDRSLHSPALAPRPRGQRSRRALATALVALVGLFVVACTSARAKRFDADAKAVCACTDAACATKAGAAFVDDYDALMKEKIDWGSAEGKRDTTAINESIVKYKTCLGKHEAADVANKACTDDKTANASTDACTACCREHGRFYDHWVDPLAAGLVGALGGPKNVGCGCK